MILFLFYTLSKIVVDYMLFNGGMDLNLNNDYNQQNIDQEPIVIGDTPVKHIVCAYDNGKGRIVLTCK